jgi:hypothetical protein
MHDDTQPADGDYGYDLAHEVTSPPAHPAEHKPEPPHFEPHPDDSDGDYGYDLAHDMRTP